MGYINAIVQRILLITESLGPGGAERQLCGLAAMLTEVGYECRVVTYIENQYFQPYLEEHGVDYRFAPFLASRQTRVPRLVKVLKDYRPDVVISYLTHVNVAACLARIFYRCKLIVSERNINVSFSCLDKLHFLLYNLADKVVTNSNCQAEFIRRHCPSLADKVVTIQNFVNTEHFVPDDKRSVESELVILTIARYAPQKNCIRYLEAVKLVKDMGVSVRFEWYGDISAEPGYYMQVKAKVLDLDIEDFISLHETVPDVLPLYQNADVFCLPSLFEGYPNTVAEAMSCGLPVICSGLYENRQIVRHGENGFLFNPYNVQDMVASIVEIAELPKSSRDLMGEKNRRAALSNNAPDVFLKKYLAVIE